MAPPRDSSEEPPAPRSAENSARINELSEDLVVQKTILESLRDLPEEGEAAVLIAEARAELGRIQKELAKARGQSHTLTFPSRPASQKNKGKMNSWNDQVLGNSFSFSGVSTPTGMSMSSASSSSNINQNRKRDYSTHLEGREDPRRANKSRRATPSPLATALTTPSTGDDFDMGFGDDVDSIIDLTGDDADIEQFLKNQREEEERLHRRRLQAQQDAEYARLIAQNSGYVSEPSSPGAGPSGPNAFDRILGRSHQASQLTSSQGVSSQSDQPTTANTGSGHVPGAFIDSDDEVSELQPEEFVNSLPAGSWNTPSTPAPPTHRTGFGPSSSINFAPGVPSAEMARRAALARMQGVPSPSPILPPYGPAAGSAYQSVYSRPQALTLDPSRPGVLQGGSYNPFQDVGSGSGNRPGDSLATLIDLTSNFDYSNMLTNRGFPLDDRYRRIFEDENPAQTEKEIKDLLQNIRPDEEFSEEDRIGTPEGLRYPLYTHQRLALQWMMKMEEGSNKGGILADDMGLGKTISTLALLLNRPPSDRVKTNLIVGPVALIKQWESEIRKKIKPKHSLSVYLYHGTGKNTPYSDLRTYDVVLTTYGKLGQQFKRYADWQQQHPGADPAAEADLAKKYPLVHPKSRFYRVILDEAQCIKNKDTLGAKAACTVNTQYRWCLTGTPMMNGVQELYSLIHFLRIKPYNIHKEFTKTFGSLAPSRVGKNSGEISRDAAMGKLRVLLKAIMLRRMKNSEIDGKPILNLPAKTEEVVHSVFSEDERSFYTDLQTKTQTQFNKYLRAGTVGKNYSNVLVLLLRLRQACCHPHLNLDVEYVANSELTVDDMVKLAKDLSPAVVTRLKEVEAFECPICYDAVADPSIVIPCGHDTCSECLTTLTERSAENNLRAGDEGSGAKCPQCRGPIHTNKIINYSTFKQVHMSTPSEEDEEEEDDEDDETSSDDDSTASESETDSEDEGDIDRNGNLKDFIVNDDDIETASEADDDNDDFVAVASRKKEKKPKKSKSKRKGKSKSRKGKEKAEEIKPHMLKTLRLEARKNKDAYRRYMRYLRKNWQTSAKVTECCELLKKIQETGEKTIVFSQFTLLLDLLEIPIKHELGLKYVRYDGGMSRNQRDVAATDFQDPASRTSVMLVSLKAGNAGLNLTAASHVIIMDPFWNPYIEMQAVDRAHRIGQQKPVQVHRILIQETVEDRIVELQEKKRALVDAALDEGESRNVGRLTTRELAYLFGVSSRS